MNKFVIVSKETFANAVSNMCSGDKELIDQYINIWYDNIQIPKRSTKYSAGYDFIAPMDIDMAPGDTFTIPTGLKMYLDNDNYLAIYPRSGLGFKYQIGLANTVGIIDADYVDNADNEGHIMIKLVNRGDKNVSIPTGKAFAQGIINKYCAVDDEDVIEAERSGGFGSTDRS